MIGIPRSIITILNPIFTDIEDNNFQYTEDEFIDAISKLYHQLSLPEKNILLNYKKTKRTSITPNTFKFRVC